MATETSGSEDGLRYCPLCEELTENITCPHDGVMTIPMALASGVIDLDIGETVAGRYQIESSLGSGGMAKVYRATQISMQRPVALKMIQPSLLHDGQTIKRFYREARAASQLSHPNIVNVHDFGVDDEKQTPFIAMELIDGQNLADILAAKGALDEARACGLLAQVARALVVAHAKGVIHRDLKPENIMVSAHLDGTEHVTVLDFGIAKIARSPDDTADSLTASGVALGTPTYMAPEQAYGDRVDLRADLYALGCMLHELLTGRPPYDAPRAARVMWKHVHEPLPELPPGIGSSGIRALHQTLLQKEPEKRALTTAQVAQVLRKHATAGLDGAPVDDDIDLGPTAIRAQPVARPWLSRLLRDGSRRPAMVGAGLGTLALVIAFVLVGVANRGPSSSSSDSAPTVRGVSGAEPDTPAADDQSRRKSPGEGSKGASPAVLEARSPITASGASPPSAGERAPASPSAGEQAPASPSAGEQAPASPSAGEQAPASPSAGERAPASPSAGERAPASPSAGERAPASPSAPRGTGTSAAAEKRTSPQRVTVLVTSVPSRAKVVEGGVVLGQTPFRLMLGPGASRRVTVQLKGYEAVDRTVTAADRRGVRLKLRKKKSADYPPLAPR